MQREAIHASPAAEQGFEQNGGQPVREGPLPVLFTHFGEDWIRGSEQVLLDLLRHLDRNRIHPVVWCNAATMAEACRALGLTTYQSPFEFYFDYASPRFDPRRYAGLVREAVRLARRHDIALFHANSGAPVQWLAPAGWLSGRPVLAHLHINYLRRSRYALLLHAADLVVGVSRQAAEDLLADGMEPERVQLIHNGIDFARLPSAGDDIRARLGIARDTPVVASIGSLVRRKGHDVLLRAFATLPAMGNNAPVLLIAGEGEDRPAFEQLAAELGLGSRARFLGYADPAAVCRAADVFALASRQDACPLVLIEAGHFGLPVVASQVGGIPEIIAADETGLLVPPEDVGALATALARLLHRPDAPALQAAMGMAARGRVGRLFTAERMAGDFMACYAALAAGQPGRRFERPRLLPYLRLLGLDRRARRPAGSDGQRPPPGRWSSSLDVSSSSPPTPQQLGSAPPKGAGQIQAE